MTQFTKKTIVDLLDDSPSDPAIWNRIGVSSVENGDLETALTCFNTVTALVPNSAVAWDNLARVHLALSDEASSQTAFSRAIAIEPNYKQARLGLAELLLSSDPEQATLVLTAGVELDEACMDLRLCRLGAFLESENYGSAALDAVTVIDCPESTYDQIMTAAQSLFKMRRIDLALTGYAKAIRLDGSKSAAFHGFGVCHQTMGSLQVAKEAYETALGLDPDLSGALKNLSAITAIHGDYNRAIEQVKRAIELSPDDRASQIQLNYYERHICDWSGCLDGDTIREICNNATLAVSPFQVLPLIDDPDLQLTLSKRWQSKFATVHSETSLRPASNRKLRVGWFGNDFHDHATLFLMSGIFREYDRSAFEFNVYSYGMIKKSAMRFECESNVDQFFDIAGMTDEEVVSLARSHELDIAVDLKVFTNGGRVSLFNERMAPIQVNFLGYPGTSGSDAYDYLIADEIVIPDYLESAYSEAVLRMPHSYQPNDSRRSISNKSFTRESEGLPEKGFVFCSFNNTYKIGPDEFDIWMSLLNSVDDSVLWLLEANSAVAENLRNEAEHRGVNPSRIVFARRVPVADHLARHSLADLFLDTFNVNAHTTASDALWAGLPVVTLPGRQFAARVGASLASAVGLSELIASDHEDYFQIARSLASDPSRLAAIRQKLEEGRSSLPLFDTQGYCRSLEKLLIETKASTNTL